MPSSSSTTADWAPTSRSPLRAEDADYRTVTRMQRFRRSPDGPGSPAETMSSPLPLASPQRPQRVAGLSTTLCVDDTEVDVFESPAKQRQRRQLREQQQQQQQDAAGTGDFDAGASLNMTGRSIAVNDADNDDDDDVLRRGQRAVRALGLTLRDTHTPHTDGHGVSVVSILRASRAEAASLRPNDLITHVCCEGELEKKRVLTVRAFRDILAGASAPAAIELTVNRDGRAGIVVVVD